MKKIVIIIGIPLMLAVASSFGQLPDFCLTKEEYRLYTLINEFRTKQGLSVIPVSRSLSYVAKVHARDLYLNNPDTSFCSLNSWSDKGPWASCCHSKFTPSPVCIVNKPRELTRYTGEGHEIAYWDSEQLQPDTILNFWKSIEQTRELLLNTKKWSHFSWKAIGIGMYKGYACVWVGDVLDTEPEPTLCSGNIDPEQFEMPYSQSQGEIISKPVGRYFIIFGSFNTKEDASGEAEKYRKAGFFQAKVIANDPKTFRVSLNDFATQKEAMEAKNKLGEKYKDAWISKF